MESVPLAFPLLIALMAFLTSASVGGVVSMLRLAGAGGGRRVHLAGGGSGLPGTAKPNYRPVHLLL